MSSSALPATSGKDATPRLTVIASAAVRGVRDRVKQTLGRLTGVLMVCPGQQDRELVTTVAVAVVLSCHFSHRGGELPEKLVALEVAQGIVYLLEVIDVEHDEANGIAARLCFRYDFANPLVELTVVEESGQRIACRLSTCFEQLAVPLPKLFVRESQLLGSLS